MSPPKGQQLIDKARIAESVHDQRKGLRELGNPHIPQGLLLRQLQVDPTRSQVDLDALHQRRVRDVETRSASGYVRPFDRGLAQEVVSRPVLTPPDDQSRERVPGASSPGLRICVALALAGALLVTVVFIRASR